MGFPNVDKILTHILLSQFDRLKTNMWQIADTFDDLDAVEQQDITTYIQRKTFSGNTRDKGGHKVFIVCDFPLVEMPLPQISITLGQENIDRYIGDQVGQSRPVTDADGNVTHWDISKGFYAQSSWNIAVVTATKDEAIWLSRLVQRFIFASLWEMEARGVCEVTMTATDLQLESGQQPMTVFNRTIKLSATTMNQYTSRIPAAMYITGSNTGG